MAEATAQKITREEATQIEPPPPGGYKDDAIIKELAADLDRTMENVKKAADLASAEQRRAKQAEKLLQKTKARNKAKLPQVALVDEIEASNRATREFAVICQQVVDSHNKLLAHNTEFRAEINELKKELRVAVTLLTTIAKASMPDPESKDKDECNK